MPPPSRPDAAVQFEDKFVVQGNVQTHVLRIEHT